MNQRCLTILDMLNREETLDVNDLALHLGVSAVTVRKDLALLENKGLLLTGRANTPSITCASCQNGIAGMRPMLRLVCEDVPICEPLSSAYCTVTVDL